MHFISLLSFSFMTTDGLVLQTLGIKPQMKPVLCAEYQKLLGKQLWRKSLDSLL